MVRRRAFFSTCLLHMALLLAACTSAAPVAGLASDVDTARIKIDDAWARPTEQGGTTAVYMVIHNNDEEADILRDVAAPSITDEAMLHESKVVNNVMIMDHVDSIFIPSGDPVELTPGGLHIMLMDVDQELSVGDQFELTLQFEHAGELELVVPVREQ